MVYPLATSHKIFTNSTFVAQLRREVTVPFTFSTKYGVENENSTNLDELWEAIDIDTGVLAIPDEWAIAHSIPLAQRFPWDETKGLYLTTAHHNLHCLVCLGSFTYL